MEINEQDNRPIYLQIADGIADAVLTGAFAEEEQIPSTTEISVSYQINPATALKGINQLVDRGIIYKKRGIGMFVQEGAREQILTERREEFYDHWVRGLITEAKRLDLSQDELQELIKRGYENV